MKTIKCVIFDFGGVIGLPQSRKYIQEMVDLSGVSKEKLLPDYFLYRSKYDQGLTDLKTYWTQILKDKDVKLTPELMGKLLYADASSWTQLNTKTVNYIHKLKQDGIHIVILSNINYDSLAFIKNTYDILDAFDESFYSCDMKLLKPDSKIYEKVLSQLKVDASECLFIDDSLDNVKGARSVGMESEQFLDFESLIQTIKDKYNIVKSHGGSYEYNN